jgi:phosphoglycolate phosphatase-like HAD superfamily hydrolase
MRPTLVLFDIDGTLVDTGGAGRLGLEASFRSVFGLDDVSRPAARVRFDGKTDPAIIADIAREAGIAAAAVEARYAELQEAYLDACGGLAVHNPRRLCRRAAAPRPSHGAARVFLGLVTGNVEEGRASSSTRSD